MIQKRLMKLSIFVVSLLFSISILAGNYRITNGKSFQILPSVISGSARNIQFNRPQNIDLGGVTLRMLPILNKQSLLAFEVISFPNPFEEFGKVLYTSPSNIEAATTNYIHIDDLNSIVQEQLTPSNWETQCISTVENLEKNGHFAALLNVINQSSSNRDCRDKVEKYYNQNSVWKDLDRKQRANQYYNTAKEIVQKMKIKGTTNYCIDEYFKEFVKLKKLRNTDIPRPYSINKKVINHIKKSLASKNIYENSNFISDGTRARLRKGDTSNFYIEQEKLGSLVDAYYDHILDSFATYYDKELDAVGLKTDLLLTKEKLLTLLEASVNSTENFLNLDEIDFSDITQEFLQGKVEHKYHKEIAEKYPDLESFEKTFSNYITSATENISNGEIDRKNMNNICFQTMRYLKEKNLAVIPDEIYKKMELRREDNLKPYKNLRTQKDIIHPDLNAETALCIAVTESSVTHFDPLTLNYGYCSTTGRRQIKQGNLPSSSALGILQMVKSTFSDGVRKDIWAPEVVSMSHLDKEIQENPNLLFEYMINDPELQIEVQLRYLNYLVKRPYLASSMQKVVRDLKESGEGDISDVYKAVIAYDQDRASCYYRKFKQCYECMNTGKQVNYCANLKIEHEDCE